MSVREESDPLRLDDRWEPVRQIVELACRAPSVHNTQPWFWRRTGRGVDLYADPSRRLRIADPEGRLLTLSCGAALHHLRVAATGLGWRAEVDHLPDPDHPDLLASVGLSPTRVVPEAEEWLHALGERRTDRRRFTSWPLPAERLNNLAVAAAEWGGFVVPVTDPEVRAEVEALALRAAEVQRRDPRFEAEATAWVGRRTREGVPRTSIPELNPKRPVPASRFLPGDLPDPAVESAEPAEGVMVLCTVKDDRFSWLRCGETLSALWLAAVRADLSVLPLTQVTEVPETRAALGRALLRGLVTPQLMLRVGWQELTRDELPRTWRRPVAEVLDPRRP